MSRRPEVRVAFVDRDPPSGFMQVDRRCLEQEFAVDHLVYPERITPAFVVACARAARRCDVVYVFFASEHGLVPALLFKALRRRFVLVPAGYDYANVPERRYGLAARGLGWLPRLLGHLCDVALPISRQTMWEFLALVPQAAPRTYLAYLAVDPAEWEDPGIERDPELVVTVGYIDEEGWSRKGIDRFVEAARNDPTRRYVLAGRIVDSVAQRLDADAPVNLERPGPLAHDDLRRLYWSAGVYAQLSWHETFGVAMAEAMLCGCTPVIRSSPALHEVAGPWAVTVGATDPSETDEQAIERAVLAGVDLDRSAMRADLSARFSLGERRRTLARAVRGMGS